KREDPEDDHGGYLPIRVWVSLQLSVSSWRADHGEKHDDADPHADQEVAWAVGPFHRPGKTDPVGKPVQIRTWTHEHVLADVAPLDQDARQRWRHGHPPAIGEDHDHVQCRAGTDHPHAGHALDM